MKSRPMMPDVPDEVLVYHIFSFLPLEDFHSASLACKKWYHILKESVERSPALRSIRGLHAAFGGRTIWSNIKICGFLALASGQCETTEQVEALAAFIKSNAEIEGWCGGAL